MKALARLYARFLAWSNGKHTFSSDPWPTKPLRRMMDRTGWW